MCNTYIYIYTHTYIGPVVEELGALLADERSDALTQQLVAEAILAVNTTVIVAVIVAAIIAIYTLIVVIIVIVIVVMGKGKGKGNI